MEEGKRSPDQFGDIVPELPPHCQQALLPLLSVSASDSQDIGFRDIVVFLHERFQFRTPQRIKEHILLQIGRDLRIRNDQFRKDGMCPAAFFAFDAKNAKDNRTLACLEAPSVIPVSNQATGMSTAAVELIQWKICCDFSVNFRSYPLEPFEYSCYHDTVVRSNHSDASVAEQERTFSG